MMRLGIVSLPSILLLGFVSSFPMRAEQPGNAPDFREVYDLIHQHLTEVSDAELNRISVQALLSALSPKVSLTSSSSAAEAQKDTLFVSKTSLFDGQIAFVRVARVGEGLDKALRQAWQEIGATNKVNGLVIDLRYTGGTDYAAASSAADLFVKKEQALLDWGQGLTHSKEKSDSLATPLAVLVNHQTSAAAEALAAVLRETGVG